MLHHPYHSSLVTSSGACSAAAWTPSFGFALWCGLQRWVLSCEKQVFQSFTCQSQRIYWSYWSFFDVLPANPWIVGCNPCAWLDWIIQLLAHQSRHAFQQKLPEKLNVSVWFKNSAQALCETCGWPLDHISKRVDWHFMTSRKHHHFMMGCTCSRFILILRMMSQEATDWFRFEGFVTFKTQRLRIWHSCICNHL